MSEHVEAMKVAFEHYANRGHEADFDALNVAIEAAADYIARLEARVVELEDALAGLASAVGRVHRDCLPIDILRASTTAMRVMSNLNHSEIPNSSPCWACGGIAPVDDDPDNQCIACNGSGKETDDE